MPYYHRLLHNTKLKLFHTHTQIYIVHLHSLTTDPMQALIVNYLGQSNQIYISLYGRENIVDVEYGLAGHWWCGWWEVVESTRRRLKDSLVNID